MSVVTGSVQKYLLVNISLGLETSKMFSHLLQRNRILLMRPEVLPDISVSNSAVFDKIARAVLLSSRYKLLDGYHSSFSGFNVSCPWLEVAVSTVSFSLLYPVRSFSVVRFEYSFVYVSLHSA